MGADDFARITVNKPGVYGLLGSQSTGEETAYGHHHEKITISMSVWPALGVESEVKYYFLNGLLKK